VFAGQCNFIAEVKYGSWPIFFEQQIPRLGLTRHGRNVFDSDFTHFFRYSRGYQETLLNLMALSFPDSD